MNDRVTATLAPWSFVAPLLQRPATEADYRAMVEALDSELDAGGDDEAHPPPSLTDYLDNFVGEYDAEHHPLSLEI